MGRDTKEIYGVIQLHYFWKQNRLKLNSIPYILHLPPVLTILILNRPIVCKLARETLQELNGWFEMCRVQHVKIRSMLSKPTSTQDKCITIFCHGIPIQKSPQILLDSFVPPQKFKGRSIDMRHRLFCHDNANRFVTFKYRLHFY